MYTWRAIQLLERPDMDPVAPRGVTRQAAAGRSARWVGIALPTPPRRRPVAAPTPPRRPDAAPTPPRRHVVSRPGNIAGMQHEVSAFHGTSTRTRFVLPGNQHRGPRSGLLRVFRTPTSQAPAVRAAASREPVRAIRAATRGAQHPADVERATGPQLTPIAAAMRWSRPRPWAKGPRVSATTPWRG